MTLMHEAPLRERTFVRLQPPAHLDRNGSLVLQQQINAAQPEQGDAWFIDMADVEFIDSAGILALTSALTFARSINRHLLVCNLRPAIKLVFEITQLDRAFEIIDGTTQPISLVAQTPQPSIAA